MGKQRWTISWQLKLHDEGDQGAGQEKVHAQSERSSAVVGSPKQNLGRLEYGGYVHGRPQIAKMVAAFRNMPQASGPAGFWRLRRRGILKPKKSFAGNSRVLVRRVYGVRDCMA